MRLEDFSGTIGVLAVTLVGMGDGLSLHLDFQ
jgi:hypothetical protein